jgi:hypothetical protein
VVDFELNDQELNLDGIGMKPGTGIYEWPLSGKLPLGVKTGGD